MKASIIISSYNQKKRLRLCLQSALNQKLGPIVTDYEVIVADDNSNDGTIDMIKENFGDKIKISLNPNSISNTYTLADNWNAAGKIATGERLIFSNGDLIYIPSFIETHADPNMKDHILLGPAMRTTSNVLYLIEDPKMDYKTLINTAASNNWLTPDMRMGQIAHTYNQEDNYWNVYGYNFSLPKRYFDAVGGFDSKFRYGGEDTALAKKVVNLINCKCLTNKNALAFHLFHSQVNHHYTDKKVSYQF